MLPYTKLPRPAGHIRFYYSPMSPPNWGIVRAAVHVFVYSNVRVALQAMMQAITTIQAQRLQRGLGVLFTDYAFYRGQADVTQRLLPTRLRGPWRPPAERDRFAVPGSPDGEDAREHVGDWYEEVEPMREVEQSLTEISEEELSRRDALERAAIERAGKVPEFASLDPFRQRAAARHYSGKPSSLLDVSTHPEVAAFFATGGASPPPAPGTIGMLWAIDVNFLTDLFSLKTTSVPGGERTILAKGKKSWGDNERMFEEYGVVSTRLELTSVELPLRRPQAQHARFLSLAGEAGSSLPPKTELTWWSIIERRACACAFIQDGHTYENPDHNVTTPALWPEDEPLCQAFA